MKSHTPSNKAKGRALRRRAARREMNRNLGGPTKFSGRVAYNYRYGQGVSRGSYEKLEDAYGEDLHL